MRKRHLVDVHDPALGHVTVSYCDDGDVLVKIAGRDIQVRNVTEQIGSGFALCYHEEGCGACAMEGPAGYMMVRRGPTCADGQHGRTID